MRILRLASRNMQGSDGGRKSAVNSSRPCPTTGILAICALCPSKRPSVADSTLNYSLTATKMTTPTCPEMSFIPDYDRVRVEASADRLPANQTGREPLDART